MYLKDVSYWEHDNDKFIQVVNVLFPSKDVVRIVDEDDFYMVELNYRNTTEVHKVQKQKEDVFFTMGEDGRLLEKTKKVIPDGNV